MPELADICRACGPAYLAKYGERMLPSHKRAISNKRIKRFEDDKVTFSYQDSKGKWHSQTLQAEKFISRFLQHVLPKGFVKVRYYGFLSPKKRNLLATIKELFNLFNSPTEKGNNDSGNSPAVGIRVMSCPKCGKPMAFVAEIKPERNRSP